MGLSEVGLVFKFPRFKEMAKCARINAHNERLVRLMECLPIMKGLPLSDIVAITGETVYMVNKAFNKYYGIGESKMVGLKSKV